MSINGGTKNGWFFSWNILLKWMIGGYPSFRKPLYGTLGLVSLAIEKKHE